MWQWLQLDGALPHNERIVTDHLKTLFGDTWIGNVAPVQWPPKSPDLYSMDFFFYGKTKLVFYVQCTDNKEKLIQLTQNAANEIKTI